jgi:hypothetical protein
MCARKVHICKLEFLVLYASDHLQALPQLSDGQHADKSCRKYPQSGQVVQGVSGEIVCVRRAPDLKALATELKVRLVSWMRGKTCADLAPYFQYEAHTKAFDAENQCDTLFVYGLIDEGPNVWRPSSL